jgi:hypothetical protein
MTPPPLQSQQHGRTRPIDVPVELAPAVERMIADFARAPSTAQPLLDYRSASTVSPRPFIHVPLAAGLCLFAGVFTWLMVAVVPRFEEIFRDFGTKLPTLTVYVLIVSRAFGHDYGWLIVWALALAIPVAVARLRPWPPRRPGSGWGVSIFVTVLLIGLLLVLIYALLQLPFVTILQSVSGGPGRP